MNVRRCRKSDAEDIAELHSKTVKAVNSEDYSKEIIRKWSDTDSSLYKDLSEFDQVKYFVAEKDGNIFGFSCLNTEEKAIKAIYTDKDHQGEGFGTALLKKMEEFAREKGIDSLTCDSSITAKKFYQSKGYEVVRQTESEKGCVKIAGFLMKKKI